jgi:hypothetical protein
VSSFIFGDKMVYSFQCHILFVFILILGNAMKINKDIPPFPATKIPLLNPPQDSSILPFFLSALSLCLCSFKEPKTKGKIKEGMVL